MAEPDPVTVQDLQETDPATAARPDGNQWLVPGWVAAVTSVAHRLAGEVDRAPPSEPAAVYTATKQTAGAAIEQALAHAQRPHLVVTTGMFRPLRRAWHRIADWWTGSEVDQAWSELHTASQGLLLIQAPAVVKSQLSDIAAAVVTALTPEDLRIPDYLKTLELLAAPGRNIGPADRAQLVAIRQACDSAADGAHADARAFRNTLILVGAALAAVLVAAGFIGWADRDFRSVFAAAGAHPGGWYLFELELIASLSGLTGAVLSLQNYTGFQYSYGLPFVQAALKGTTGAATGLFGVALARSGVAGSFTLHPGADTFAVAIVFGYGQYLFTRLVDKQANAVLKSAGARSDPAVTPQAPPGARPPVLLTTDATRCPQVTSASPKTGPAEGGTLVALRGAGFTAAASVMFGGQPAADVTIDSDSQITVASPPGHGTVAITVTSSVGVSPVSAAAQFAYAPAPGG